jgi:magnesium transporter
MTTDFVIAPATLSADGVLDHIRPQLARPDFVYFIYLVDDVSAPRLRGVVTLRDLNLAEPATPVAQLMRTDLQTIGPLESAAAAARRVADYGLNALPVVDQDRCLLGIVTVDRAIAQLVPPSWRARLPRVFS